MEPVKPSRRESILIVAVSSIFPFVIMGCAGMFRPPENTEDRLVHAAELAILVLLGVAGCAILVLSTWFASRVVELQRDEFAALRSPERRRIKGPPGTRLDAFVSFWLSTKAYDGVFKQIISDMRIEYNDALEHGLVAKARWVRIRWTFVFWLTLVTYFVTNVVEPVAKILKPFK